MQTIISESAPYDDILLSEEDVIITSTRLEIENTTYALKYITTVTISETHPPRDEARLVVFLGIVAMLAVVVYAILGKMTVTGFIIYAASAFLALVIGALVYWLDPSKYTLDLKLVNGESAQFSHNSERFIHRVHNVLMYSLAMDMERKESVNRMAPPAYGRPNDVSPHGTSANGRLNGRQDFSSTFDKQAARGESDNILF